ncbi:hypothetical protein D3C80_2067060 [compost metagenome]
MIFCRLITPVMFFERQLDMLVHDLHRLVQIPLPDETGSQNIVRTQCPQPGLPETLHVQAVHVHP